MTHLQFLSIKNVAIWAPDVPDSTVYTVLRNNQVNDSAIPASLKRRCSRLNRKVLAVANQAMGLAKVDYAIFCSQHGELNCAVTLLKDICAKTILSPLKFSQSVHNTAAGLFSVMHAMHQDMTSIAAGENTFFMGMVEALTWMQLNPNKNVLLVLFDEHIPAEYKSLPLQNNYEYVVAFLLSDESAELSKSSLSFELSNFDININKKNNFVGDLPLALEFFAWYSDPNAKELLQMTSRQAVKWCKKQ